MRSPLRNKGKVCTWLWEVVRGWFVNSGLLPLHNQRLVVLPQSAGKIACTFYSGGGEEGKGTTFKLYFLAETKKEI